MLFDSISNSAWFVRTSIILFLNKVRTPFSLAFRSVQAPCCTRSTSSRSVSSFLQFERSFQTTKVRLLSFLSSTCADALPR